MTYREWFDVAMTVIRHLRAEGRPVDFSAARPAAMAAAGKSGVEGRMALADVLDTFMHMGPDQSWDGIPFHPSQRR